MEPPPGYNLRRASLIRDVYINALLKIQMYLCVLACKLDQHQLQLEGEPGQHIISLLRNHVQRATELHLYMHMHLYDLEHI